jgi:phage major head subunit gpT-like protein
MPSIDINSAAARLRLREDWKAVSFKAFDNAPPSVCDIIAEKQSSSAAVNVYDMVIALPVMKRFQDQVKVQQTARAQHRIENDELEATVEVPQASIERGEAAQFNNKFEMLGYAVRRRADRFLAQLLIDGFTVNDYSGTTFFADAKPHIPDLLDAGTYDNKMTEKPSAGSWEVAKQKLGYILDPNGEPMNVASKLVVVCSTKWATTFKKILNAETILEASGTGDATVAAAVSNIYRGDADLIEFKHLNTAARQDYWFVFNVGEPVRGIISQTETQPRFYAQDDPNTHKDAFDRHVFRYQAYQRAAVGFGLPQFCIGSTGAANAL